MPAVGEGENQRETSHNSPTKVQCIASVQMASSDSMSPWMAVGNLGGNFWWEGIGSRFYSHAFLYCSVRLYLHCVDPEVRRSQFYLCYVAYISNPKEL